MYFIGIRSKPKIALVYNDRSQIFKNCYISQLHEALKRRFQIVYVPEKRLEAGERLSGYGVISVFVILKSRTWKRCISHLRDMFGDKELIFYDQDPWESYHDDGICRGVYKEVAQHLNVGHFFITSQFWSTYVARVDELPTQYVRMGMLPRLCSYGKAPSRRNTLIGFQGTLHQNRKEFFDRVGQFGLNVTLMKSASHKSYLKNLRRMKIFLHSENPKLTIEGSRIDLNATWIKDLEVASQGCFAIRSWDVEADKYGIEAIPLIKSFRDESEIPNLVEEVLSMSTVQTRDEVEESVDRIKARDDWDQLAHAVANPGGSSYRF